MKFAFCTEDSSDAEILRALMSRVCGQEILIHEREYRVPLGGWNKVLELASVFSRAAFNSDARGVVFAIDADAGEPLHEVSHEQLPVEGCRHCGLVRAARVDEVLSWSRPGLPPLRFFFTVPVRTLETWLLAARGARIPGDASTFGRTGAERRQLKRLLYGSEAPVREHRIEVGLAAVRDGDLDLLSSISPSFAMFRSSLLGL